jgi:hypothetical protein
VWHLATRLRIFDFQRRQFSLWKAYVRFGSLADIGPCRRHVRFTPESGHPPVKRRPLPAHVVKPPNRPGPEVFFCPSNAPPFGRIELMLDWLDIISRFGAATAIGALIGLYFELHQKPTGVRTLGLVALAIEIVAIGKFSFALGVER